MAGITIGDITSAIDSIKRRTGASLREIATDPLEFLRQGTALQMGPSRQAMADPNALLASPGGTVSVGGIPGVTTWHGTPHQVSRYSLGKVGSGQGAQSYGHGIYFAEHPEVAGSYRNQMAGNPDELARIAEEVHGLPEQVADDFASFFSQGRRFDDVIAEAKKALGNPLVSDVQKRRLQMLLDHEVPASDAWRAWKTEGNLYKQELPDEVLPKMLDWDKTLAEQPEYVRKRLKDFIDAQGGDLHAGDLVRGGDVEDILRLRGIPGVSYLDQGSRGAGKGTRNHVVWDQELLDRMFPEAVR